MDEILSAIASLGGHVRDDLVDPLCRTNLHPLTQSFICTPIGVVAGVAFICLFEPQRRIAIYLLETVRELTNKR
jgi:hypothetical protein